MSLISAAGDVDPALCAPFTRGAGSQLKPPQNFLQNLANITTSGEDFKGTWLSAPLSFGHLSAAMQATRVNDYKAVDTLGLVAQRQVGIEVANTAIPRWRVNAQLGWAAGGFDVNWNLRFLSAVQEFCSNAPSTIPVPGCEDSAGKFSKTTFHNLHSILYHDVQVSWTDAFHLSGFKIEAGVNSLFGTNPPVCYTCTY